MDFNYFSPYKKDLSRLFVIDTRLGKLDFSKILYNDYISISNKDVFATRKPSDSIDDLFHRNDDLDKTLQRLISYKINDFESVKLPNSEASIILNTSFLKYNILDEDVLLAGKLINNHSIQNVCYSDFVEEDSVIITPIPEYFGLISLDGINSDSVFFNFTLSRVKAGYDSYCAAIFYDVYKKIIPYDSLKDHIFMERALR